MSRNASAERGCAQNSHTVAESTYGTSISARSFARRYPRSSRALDVNQTEPNILFILCSFHPKPKVHLAYTKITLHKLFVLKEFINYLIFQHPNHASTCSTPDTWSRCPFRWPPLRPPCSSSAALSRFCPRRHSSPAVLSGCSTCWTIGRASRPPCRRSPLTCCWPCCSSYSTA